MGLLMGLLLFLGTDPVIPANNLGSATFSAGYGNRTGNDPPGGSLVLKGALMIDMWRSFGLGLEAGFYMIEQESLQTVADYPLTESIVHLGALAQYTFGTGPLRPYLQAGIGRYTWGSDFLGASGGGGVRYQPDYFGYFGFIEGRWHENLQNQGIPSPGFYTISAGAGVSW